MAPQKVGQSVNLALTSCDWTDEIADHLVKAISHATREDLHMQIERGAVCYAIRQDGALIGAYMLRIDQTASGAQGVIIAASGHLDGLDLLDTVYPAIEGQLEAAGCTSVRVHTARPGIGRMMMRRGFGAFEIVLTKVIKYAD